MASPVQLVAKARGGSYLELQFVQDGEVMTTYLGAVGEAGILLQYPRQGDQMRDRGDSTETERKAKELNSKLEEFNELLRKWCS